MSRKLRGGMRGKPAIASQAHLHVRCKSGPGARGSVVSDVTFSLAHWLKLRAPSACIDRVGGLHRRMRALSGGL